MVPHPGGLEGTLTNFEQPNRAAPGGTLWHFAELPKHANRY